MELQAGRQVLDGIKDSLDQFDADLVPRGDRLACAELARGLASRLTVLSAVLLAKADATQVSLQQAGTPTTSWLTLQAGLSKREAAGLLHQARELAGRPDVAQAAASGRISVGQAKAIGTVLGCLNELDEPQGPGRTAAARHGGQHGQRPARESDPAGVGASRATRRRRNPGAAAATPSRGSPTEPVVGVPPGRQRLHPVHRQPALVDGEAWIAQLDAYTESQRRTALEERDPAGAGPTPEQRRADALVAMIINHGKGGRVPKVGGDRPRIVVTVDYAKLLVDATAAGLIGDGEPLSAGELRRLCCDADLLPAVLGGPSTVLDVGRDCRLVPADMRTALVLRDGGCVFPGCHARPSECEAHHIIPWWKGGPTALSNLVLLCHHHHGLIEPARYTVRDQWEIRIAADGLPETIPPRRCDPQRQPLRHARHHTGQDPGTARDRPSAEQLAG